MMVLSRSKKAAGRPVARARGAPAAEAMPVMGPSLRLGACGSGKSHPNAGLAGKGRATLGEGPPPLVVCFTAHRQFCTQRFDVQRFPQPLALVRRRPRCRTSGPWSSPGQGPPCVNGPVTGALAGSRPQGGACAELSTAVGDGLGAAAPPAQAGRMTSALLITRDGVL